MSWGFGVFAAAALVACAKPPPSEKPVETAAPVATSAPTDQKDDVEVAASAAPTVDAVAPKPPEGTASAGSVLDRMPATCAEGRFYGNLDKLAPPKAVAALDDAIAAAFAKSKGAKAKAGKVYKTLEKNGLRLKNVKSFAVCVNGAEDTVVAIDFDQTKVKNAADGFEQAIKVGDEPPKKEVVGSTVWLSSATGRDTLAVMGATLVFGKSRPVMEAAVKGGTKGAGFGDAEKLALFAQTRNLSVQVSDNADALALEALVRGMGQQAGQIQQRLRGFEQDVGARSKGEQAILKPLMPLAQSLQVAADGDDLSVKGGTPKSVFVDLAKAIKGASQRDIENTVVFFLGF
jgi:hypothetical protein